MALIERYANAWHMLIERQYLICKNYVYWSGVQVSNRYYSYLRVSENKYLIVKNILKWSITSSNLIEVVR